MKNIDAYTPENLKSAEYLDHVLNETLRLTPPLYFLPRQGTVDVWVETTDGRRLFIPKGIHILLDVELWCAPIEDPCAPLWLATQGANLRRAPDMSRLGERRDWGRGGVNMIQSALPRSAATNASVCTLSTRSPGHRLHRLFDVLDDIHPILIQEEQR